MKKNLRFIWLLVKYKFSRMMMYRADFFFVFFCDGALFLVQLLAFEAIYSQVDSIGGWGRGEMIVFVGTFSLINGLNMLVYFFGIVGIPGKIRRGDLDQYLTKPVNPLLRLTFENADLGSFPLLILSALIIAYGVNVSGIAVTPARAFGYAALVIIMTVLWYDMELIIRTIPFFVMSADGIMEVEGQLLELNFKVPGILYKGAFKFVFYFLLPYGIMSTVPTQVIAGSVSAPGAVTAALTAAAFTAFALRFWKRGLKNYESAGG